jgi:large subunit ribosomal protein L10
VRPPRETHEYDIQTAFRFGWQFSFLQKTAQKSEQEVINMAKVELKAPVIDEIKEVVGRASSAVLVDYRGLTVEQDTKLRKELREAGVVYKVYKNTFLKRAFEGTDFAQLDSHLDGPTAIAFGIDDATAPARIIAKHIEKIEALTFKSGVVEGTYYDVKGLDKLSKIPSREVLISKLLGSMQAPIANMARVLKQIAEKQDGGNEAA